ncbi:MAG: 30S ribosomal protein S8e [Methanotrichaceae archaeon]|nr:30S ribosomal protein S8e [Methanotrichaceae archaeon]
MRWQGKSARKVSGGRLIICRGKRKFEIGREAGDTTIAPTRKKTMETMGGNQKTRLLRGDVACVSDPKTGGARKAKIETVVDNKANLHYIRRNIVTRGAIIKTELGNARVTNRPSQEGIINAVLIAE